MFWIGASNANSYELWAQPIGGGAPRTIACSDTPMRAVAANDQVVYWIDNAVHRLDVKAL